MTCDNCSERVYRVRSIGGGKFVCLPCLPTTEYTSAPRMIEMVPLNLGNGHKVSLPRTEINEIKRHVMLPYEAPGGGWYSGRRGDNGKIQERPLKS